MIEMRWKNIMSKVEHNGIRPVVKVVLQYRQMIDKTIYAHAETNALSREWINNGHKHTAWSDWQDVPTVEEIPA